ncbi:MAG: putative transcriptional regulator [Steroidobacteraceae bacterium]|jgi:DNA-binding HxlR family transcriptional regulator|nr:putative transcriptional regulator [Steroidobacteraceae bacterium]
MKRSNRRRRSGCPISIALEIFGDTWSLLIVRDLMFKGFRTFNEFLGAGEGIASNVLTDRLSKLESAGVIVKREHDADARRYEYRLTEKGIDLASVMVEIVLWSARHEQTDAPPQILRAMRTQREKFLSDVREGWQASQQ